MTRVHTALGDAGLLGDLSEMQLDKIEAFPGDLSSDTDGGCLSPGHHVHSRIINSVTHIIHNAWPVNFNLSLQSFEARAIRPTHRFISLALASNLRPRPIFTFVSSIATVINTRSKVLEKPYPWEYVGPMGYGQSKWVAEEILGAAAAATREDGPCSVRVRVARVGQVVGDTRLGRWKPSEAYPTVVQSALTIGALPLIEAAPSDGVVHNEHFWLPADVAGAAIADVALCHIDDGHGSNHSGLVAYFNLSSAVPIRWNSEFALAVKELLARYGDIHCELVPQREWLRRLEESDPDVMRNPPRKLLDFFRKRYGEVEVDGRPVLSEPALDITQTCRVSPRVADRHEWAGLFAKCVKYWVAECWNRRAA
jgi:thioester reductase-like protein